jgi:hypothetical protein
MSDDTREDILSQVETLLKTIPGIVGIYRDRGDLANFKLPAIVLLDGDEHDTLGEEIDQKKRVYFPGTRVAMQPTITIIPVPRTDATNLMVEGPNGTAVAAPIGPEMSMWRMAVRTAIENDQTLVGLLAPTGQLLYRGFDTDMVPEGTSLTMLGRMILRYEIRYWLFPTQSGTRG